MPIQTQDAVNWALQQSIIVNGVTYHIAVGMPQEIVDKVREYFNNHNIPYDMFSYDDLYL